MTDSVIINACVTGAVLTKNDTPHLPITQEEIVTAAREVTDAGAAIVHLHARNEDQSNSHDPKVFVELVRAVRDACPDVIVSCSLSGRFTSDIEARAAALEAQPELASLTMGSMNFATDASVNTPETIKGLATRTYDAGGRPELEIFEPGMAHMARVMVKRGQLREPLYANIILGALGASPLDYIGLGHMIQLLPVGTTWSVGGLGRFQTDAIVMALGAGGHVRVGLEDNIHLDRQRSVFATNAQLVERVVRIAREIGREPASPQEARRMIGLT
jgi:uncharacterized protein (DUF849 family)